MYFLGIQVGCFLNTWVDNVVCLPGLQKVFSLFLSLVHEVDMSCLFIRLSTEKCCTNVVVILSSLGWQDAKEAQISVLAFILDFCE